MTTPPRTPLPPPHDPQDLPPATHEGDTYAHAGRPRRWGVYARVSVYIILSLMALVWSFTGLEVSPERIARGLPQASEILRQMFGNPDWGYFREKVIFGLKESLQIAALGTAIAAVLAIPFGVLAARNLSRLYALPFIGKVLLNMIRTFPELVLALVFIKALGPGPFAGVLAVGFHSIGMIGKLYAERIETVDKGALEALSASGASPVEVFRHGILPEVFPDFLSYALYRFDLNVRSATVLGLVGAGGVGTLLQFQFMASNWRTIGVILIGIIITVGLVDFVSARLRARLA
jgi:phosphonate transport system permease protein